MEPVASASSCTVAIKGGGAKGLYVEARDQLLVLGAGVSLEEIGSLLAHRAIICRPTGPFQEA